jgi:aspartate carbamoyltransferase catalytic subunit
MQHVLEAQQFSRKDLDQLFAVADKLEKGNQLPLRGKILASLFYEPSTRTRFSFESAMIRLGGNVLTTENAREFSSAAKGETLEDTIRVVNAYADAIVLRHYEAGAAQRASEVSHIPIINAGDGAGQHPTQALLDLYTIQKEIGTIDGIQVAMVGDLKNGRTVRSLSYLLGKCKDVEIFFISPKELEIGEDIKEYLRKHGVVFRELNHFDSVLKDVDVLYQTRVQKERFEDVHDYEKFKGMYVLTVDNTQDMRKGAVIMHPLPRVDEISPDLDALPRAAYFRQAEYGLLVRMALLQQLLGE